ncbi:MAG: hypothetical protein BWY52_02777 [Chloroflexi bacterium ADurb.Bin325]|nr:MAG: hypothetical protein BWY52_02777 [Chloroflexi bacterium ADurb.Bin325]
MQTDTWRQVAPVLVSMLIILAVALLRNHSRVLAGILGTMPINVALSLWIVYSGARGERSNIQQYTDTLPYGILGTVAFILAVWLAARAGWKLLPMLAIGYVAWGATLALIFALRQWLKF